MKPDYAFLASAGLSQDEVTKIFKCKDLDIQIQMLRKYRYKLLEKIHEEQESESAKDGQYRISR